MTGVLSMGTYTYDGRVSYALTVGTLTFDPKVERCLLGWHLLAQLTHTHTCVMVLLVLVRT